MFIFIKHSYNKLNYMSYNKLNYNFDLNFFLFLFFGCTIEEKVGLKTLKILILYRIPMLNDFVIVDQKKKNTYVC